MPRMARKHNSKSEFVLFGLVYDDGSERPNRRAPARARRFVTAFLRRGGLRCFSALVTSPAPVRFEAAAQRSN
jgi:hypothetical protein